MCMRLGASIVNDVEGFITDPAMMKVAADTNCGCVVMHWDKGGLGTRPPRRQVQLDDSSRSRREAVTRNEYLAAPLYPA